MTRRVIRDDIELVNRPATTIDDSLQQSLQDCSTHTFVDCNVKHNGVNFHGNHWMGVSTDLKTMPMRYGWEFLSFLTNHETDDHKMSKSPMKIKTERHQCWNGSLNTTNVQRMFISTSIIFSHCVWYNFNKLASNRGCQVDHQKKNIVFPAFCMVSIPETAVDGQWIFGELSWSGQRSFIRSFAMQQICCKKIESWITETPTHSTDVVNCNPIGKKNIHDASVFLQLYFFSTVSPGTSHSMQEGNHTSSTQDLLGRILRRSEFFYSVTRWCDQRVGEVHKFILSYGKKDEDWNFTTFV